ncbi:hypothetical protein [Enterobacter roggenkampii]|uniref:hypothetical protein n=1 Tax=Enterobacter roggenkampii TaxID=1812935 RepID=UPI0007359F20|nr:hypothetical protein [Enterobacter roggenkampii]KTI34240.1 hypothetical protein ASV07_14740 [Enterobacter roggenkampii]
MSTITKQWLQQKIAYMEAVRDEIPFGLDEDDSNTLAALRYALASLEAEPAIHRWRRVTSEPYGPYPWHYGDFIGFSKPVDGIEDEYFYSAPPAPVSVPAAMEMDDDFDSAFEHGKAVGWNAYRAAMLQGANGTLTNDGTRNHSEDNLDMVDHSGDANEKGNSPAIPDAEPVSNRDELPDDVSTVLAEAYQVVGVMAEALGVFDDTAVQKVMDNLSQQKLIHREVLPFSLPAAPQQEVK